MLLQSSSFICILSFTLISLSPTSLFHPDESPEPQSSPSSKLQIRKIKPSSSFKQYIHNAAERGAKWTQKKKQTWRVFRWLLCEPKEETDIEGFRSGSGFWGCSLWVGIYRVLVCHLCHMPPGPPSLTSRLSLRSHHWSLVSLCGLLALVLFLLLLALTLNMCWRAFKSGRGSEVLVGKLNPDFIDNSCHNSGSLVDDEERWVLRMEGEAKKLKEEQWGENRTPGTRRRRGSEVGEITWFDLGLRGDLMCCMNWCLGILMFWFDFRKSEGCVWKMCFDRNEKEKG